MERKGVVKIKFKIHRGTKEIGGSCVEIWTKSTRIIVDLKKAEQGNAKAQSNLGLMYKTVEGGFRRIISRLFIDTPK